MVWEYEEMSLEKTIELIKGFIDILILCSGHQSSGFPALWDSLNILKAFHWSFFFHHLITCLTDSDLKELDSALSQITSDPKFPQGLVHLSVDTLKNAKDFVLEHMLCNVPLKDDHLKALLTAVAEVELDVRSNSRCGCLELFGRISLGEECADGCFVKCTVREIMRRRSAVSCVLTAEIGLNLVSDSIRCGSRDTEKYLLEARKDQDKGRREDEIISYVTWSNWKSRSLSYFLDNRTLRLVSGASILFSAPKTQWVQVFGRMKVSANHDDTDFSEAVELLLLGCIASQWSKVVEHFTTISFDSTTVSKQFLAVFNLLSGMYHSSNFKQDMVDPKNFICSNKEFGMLEYLTELVGGQIRYLWKLAPALVAVAIPSWSTLFKLYLNELEAQFKGAYSTIRSCRCLQDKREHEECDLAERIWCLYMFHVCGFQQVDKA